jgi:hypothetical protein
MQHRNAPLTPTGRLRLVELVEEEGLRFEAAAAASKVAKSTVHLCVTRWREASDEQRATLACLRDRRSRPHTSPNRVPAEAAERICERRRRTGWSPRRLACEPDIRRPHSTIHQVPRRGGCSCRPAPERGAVVSYQWPCPGQLLHMDVKKLARFEAPGHALTAERARRTRGAGWDTCTRSSTTARGLPTRRSTPTNAPRPSPPAPAARSTGSTTYADVRINIVMPRPALCREIPGSRRGWGGDERETSA